MKLLVVGSGGREHALAWKLLQSPKVSKVYVAPGNAGTASTPGMHNVPITETPTLAAFAKREKIGLTVVGPEAPLSSGIVDAFRADGLRIFGPTQAAARLESSKDFAKAFMLRHGIPTARYRSCSDCAEAHAYVDEHGPPLVVKADGLASGKGVVIAMSAEEAHAAVDKLIARSPKLVLEDCLQGEEASFIAMVDGRHVLALATSQDHKRLEDGDQGPNTGGMGAYSPAPVVSPDVYARVMREVIYPTVLGMEKEGAPYSGFLYAGLMVSPEGKARVLEFNCRLGDPEAQPILMRLKTDLVFLIESALAGKLGRVEAEWDRRVALGVVLAAAGYPDSPRSGDAISGLPRPSDDLQVFHSGTKKQDGQIVTSGGRVLCVTALADSIMMARARAYETAQAIHFEGRLMRTDIGARALKR
ncbi:MAG TPA: phosphoribosylamine--glycine ligase [Burkholderiales bacterium]|nr:phosphoribosylamine--glycine ligase [Burkholderiales bacterium]